MSATEICYWCGAAATSKEHVPPRSFYPPDSAPRRILVPACSTHNRDFAKIDERFRFYIQASCESDAAFAAFQDKTLRGLKRPESAGFCKSLAASSSPATMNGEKSLAFEISPKDQSLFFEKVARGIYFHHIQKPFGGSIKTACTHLVNPLLDYKAVIAAVRSMDRDIKEGTETDNSVFSYKYQRIIEPDGEGFLLIGCFYEDVHFFAFGVDQTQAEECTADQSDAPEGSI